VAAKVHELANKRETILSDIRKLQTNFAKDGALDSKEFKERRDELKAQLVEVDREWQAENELLALERQFGSNAPPRDPHAPPVPGSGLQPGALASSDVRSENRRRSYAAIFGPPESLASEGWPSMDAFVSGLLAGNHPSLRAQSESVDSQGGWAVPQEITARAFDTAVEDSVFLRLARLEPMQSLTKRVTGVAARSAVTNGPYGIAVEWPGEEGVFNFKTFVLGKVELRAKKCGLLIRESTEVIEDAGGFMPQFDNALSRALSWAIDDNCFCGPGGPGRPMGVTVAPSTVVVTPETSQTGANAATIVWLNVVKMLARLHPAAWPNAIWACTHTALPQLLQLVVPTGVSGTWVPVLSNASGQYSIFGKPLYVTEKLPAVGTKGDLVLFDPQMYLVGMRRGMTLVRSQHTLLTSDSIAILGTMRVDGQSAWDTVYTPKTGPTLGPAVVLDTRS
jgi:HK97 family phage major capsid protein